MLKLCRIPLIIIRPQNLSDREIIKSRLVQVKRVIKLIQLIYIPTWFAPNTMPNWLKSQEGEQPLPPKKKKDDLV